MSAEALTAPPTTAHLQLVDTHTAPAWAQPQRMPRPLPPLALVPQPLGSPTATPPTPAPPAPPSPGKHGPTTSTQSPAAEAAVATPAELAPTLAPMSFPGPAPSSLDAPGPARAHARALAQALAEVLHGLRPSHQLSHWLDLEMLQKMQRRVRWEQDAARAMGAQLGNGPAQVIGCHVQLVGAACECSATLVTRNGARAVCFRLELRRNRWRGVAVELG
ncbi:Rv3235 family protein [Galactobacter caseinivorans]|uniref:Uncharacterized protein n=1 Tax=Galactobacter caseinivorans TaxID=2676123 RepID=A0A496PM94_9MICC|nr:Rv3235 family protein [Galactobacter caseinivorans]RKW71647.1 hypothetical protein DWQ67_02070 [Galactobacter caseinivorans]